MNLSSSFDDEGSSFTSTDVSDDFSVDDALEQLGEGVGGLRLSEVVGRGAFGSVYKVFWKGKPAALKVIEQEQEQLDTFLPSRSTGSFGTSSATGIRGSQALLEAAVSSAIQHPCIVETYDYQLVDLQSGNGSDPLSALTGTMELRIVMEWCDAGSLAAALSDGRLQPAGAQGNAASFEAICTTLMEVALAMEHLHAMHIMHRDLKAKNVLLSSSLVDARGFTAKVSDFGLSKLVADTAMTYPGESSNEASGTITHMAPETLSEGKASPAADVYAFGILMWEAYMGDVPYGSMNKMQVMYGVVSEGLCPEFPPGTPAWYAMLAAACWSRRSADRPTFVHIVLELREKIWAVQHLRSRHSHGNGGMSVHGLRNGRAVHQHAPSQHLIARRDLWEPAHRSRNQRR